MSRSASANIRVNRVARLDGSTRVSAVLRSPMVGWEPVGRSWLTADAVEAMRALGIRVVRLRRGFHTAEIPLAWLMPERPVRVESSDRLSAAHAS